MSIRHIDHLLKLAALFEKLASGEGYYIVLGKGDGTADMYGPFADAQVAKKMSYFGQPLAVGDGKGLNRFPFRTYLYDQNEIAGLKESPEEMSEYTKIRFHPPHLPMHPSWEKFFDKSLSKLTPEEWWEGRNSGRW